MPPPYTRLSVLATPGPKWIIHRPDRTRGTDLFTKLCVLGIPWERFGRFASKEAIVTGRPFEFAGSRYRKLDIKIPDKLKISMEEEEILELIAAILRIL